MESPSSVIRALLGGSFYEQYVDAFREKGIKIGLYYSLIDWSHSDYPSVYQEEVQYMKMAKFCISLYTTYLGKLSA